MDLTVTDQTKRCWQLTNQCFFCLVSKKIHFLAGTVIETERDTLPPSCKSERLKKTAEEKKSSSKEVKYYRSVKTAGGGGSGACAKAIKTPKAKIPQ